MYENAESHYIHRYILSLYINKSILSAIAYEMDVMNRWKSYMFVQYKQKVLDKAQWAMLRNGL